jgi:hypothetical protein
LKTKVAPFPPLSTVLKTKVTPFPPLSTVLKTKVTPFPSLSTVLKTKVTPFPSLSTVLKTKVTLFPPLSTVLKTKVTPFLSLSTVLKTKVTPFPPLSTILKTDITWVWVHCWACRLIRGNDYEQMSEKLFQAGDPIALSRSAVKSPSYHGFWFSSSSALQPELQLMPLECHHRNTAQVACKFSFG